MEKIGEIGRTLILSNIAPSRRSCGRCGIARDRKVVRGQQTSSENYERAVQPSPKLGAWVEVLTEILEQEAKLPKRDADPAAIRGVARGAIAGAVAAFGRR